MPTTLVLTFPLGRYHATPWDRHVNEGAVELPPSPWRLLRALYAVWQNRCPELPKSMVHALLTELAEPPAFSIPPHTLSHTRHYYPDSADGTDRILDAFAAFGPDDQLAVSWPCDLDPEQRGILERLAEALPYLGRADSICDGSIDNAWTPRQHTIWRPTADAEKPEGEAVPVLAPDTPLNLDALLARPVDVRRSGRRLPVGSRVITYQSQPPAHRPQSRTAPRPTRQVTAVRFDLLQPAFPPDTHSAIYTDLLRQAAIDKLGRAPQGTMLGGRTFDNQPMRNAGHAHYLPIIQNRRLTGLVVWIPGTLPDKELDALCDVRTLYDHKRHTPVRVAGIGEIGHIAPELAKLAATWRSVTPFTPSRYPKKNRDHRHSFIIREIERELAPHIPPPTSIEFLDRPWTTFVRHRPSARRRGDTKQGQARQPAEFLRLHFEQPITGPIALGRLNHFGLGLFTPET
ncbi:type I-G CRISPR-associated protein Csb2 [Nocardia alni]|uniref:type I-G CRISPR-associated protein Csb2 n=1 Tax=Nocardia alni TaxID=2815723 RepID=UPI001C22E70A|nr:type I-U CRISPR-associated protein Csb2 [Nocardia alni]